MDFTYLETVMAFFGLASIVIGSFADRLTEHMLREPQAMSTERHAPPITAIDDKMSVVSHSHATSLSATPLLMLA
jgi:hypothetical protein